MTAAAIRFPWPNSKLSSNSRTAHRYLTAERQTAREIGYWLIKDARLTVSAVPLQLTLTLRPPDRRRRDLDNILTAFKSYSDGMFKALGVDDSLIRRTVIERSEVEKGGAVYVELSELRADVG